MTRPRVHAERREGSVLLRVGCWVENFPISMLDHRIAFYRGLRDRPSKLYGTDAYRRHYAATVDALEEVRQALAHSESAG